jgi:hypothetical protein
MVLEINVKNVAKHIFILANIVVKHLKVIVRKLSIVAENAWAKLI